MATLETVYIIISNNNVTDIGLICSMHVSTDVSTGFNCGYGRIDLLRRTALNVPEKKEET